MQSAASYRKLRTESIIKRAMIEIFKIGKSLDSRIFENSITVSAVILSNDLRIAKCFVVPFGLDKMPPEELMDALEQSKKSIRYMLGKKVKLKYLPEIRFFYDSSFSNTDQIYKLLELNSQKVF